MKKFFQIIGLFSLLIFSFFLTDKTATVIKNMDDIMVEIKKNEHLFKEDGVNAIIKDNTIIPGISFKKVNINSSYRNMKEYGKYNEDLYVYDYIKPKISIINNKDKYIISGNKNKRMVSLNFLINKNTNINQILNILEEKNIKATFFVTDGFLKNNLNTCYNLILNGYNIGIYSNNKSDFKWMNTVIKKIGKQKDIYCYYENKKTIDYCKSIDGFTIKGIDIENNYYKNVVDNLDSGVLFNFNVTDELLFNINNIINFIEKKGFIIKNIETHINE